ncbi:type II toxin-antitoxin system HicB family antitoxin [Pseudomonas sp. MDT1-16]
MYDYAIRFEECSASGLAMFCRDLPELNSYGDDRERAISEALDAIETTLSIYVDQRRVIPVASAPEAGEHVVRLPAVTVAKDRAMERHDGARHTGSPTLRRNGG